MRWHYNFGLHSMNRIKFTLVNLTLLFLVACGRQEKVEEAEVIRPVRTIVLEKTGSRAIKQFSGVVRSSMESALSFRVGGTLETLHVKVGDLVEKRTLLAQLDETDYKVKYDQAVAAKNNAIANRKSAETNVSTARSNYERIEKLYESNSVPISELEKAENDYKTANAQLAATASNIDTTNSQIEGAQNQLKYTKLIAPFAGIITSIPIEENELVSSGTTVMKISASDRPEIEVSIPDTYIAKVRKGQKVSISLSIAPNKKYNGTVEEVSFTTGSGSTYPVKIVIDESVDDIRPGMAATIIFDFGNQSIERESSIYIPPSAVGEGPDGRFVYVIERQSGDVGVARKRIIVVGELNTLGFEVQSGLDEGEIVATAGLQVLLDGMKVLLEQ